ncbi:MAG: penicillin-binding protein 2 [Pseudomonadota bacterium]
MRSKTQIKDAHAEQRMFLRRSVVAAAGIVVLVGLLVARLVHLQVFEHQQLLELSLGNSLRIQPLAPTRGLIFDRDGEILAENLPQWQLELIPERVDDIDETLARLVAERFIDAADLPGIRERVQRALRFQPVVLKSGLDDRETARFAAERMRYRGVDIAARLVRHYPNGPLGAHAIGYVGGLSERDLASLAEPANYTATAQFGKTGIEAAFETRLHGRIGYHEVLTNAHGRALASYPSESPRPGQNVHLTVSLKLQRIAEEALAGRRGAVVAVDPRNGEVLVLASTPSFDPNAFATGLNTDELNALIQDLDRPLFNRAVRGRYPPGSTIKPMLAIAALETHITDLNHRIFCRGSFSLPGSSHRYRDWKPEGHGLVDLHDAVTQSCDVFFYELAPTMGIDTIHAYLTQFGLGELTGIEIGGEKAGLIPSRAWKQANFSRREDQRWFQGETVIASIGQGYMLATPLQLAHSTAAIAMRGPRYRSRILAYTEDPVDGSRLVTTPESLPAVQLQDSLHWEAVINSMQDVLQGETGTARAVGRNAPYSMAGKSGTAQVFSVAQDEEYNEDELEERLIDHALFIAFAPVEEPTIAVAVIIENGSSGSRVAAPVARAVMDGWLLGDDDAALAAAARGD